MFHVPGVTGALMYIALVYRAHRHRSIHERRIQPVKHGRNPIMDGTCRKEADGTTAGDEDCQGPSQPSKHLRVCIGCTRCWQGW
jgi:hypothetical protein